MNMTNHRLGWARRAKSGTAAAVFLRVLQARDDTEGDAGGGDDYCGEGVQRGGRHREVQSLAPGHGEISAR